MSDSAQIALMIGALTCLTIICLIFKQWERKNKARTKELIKNQTKEKTMSDKEQTVMDKSLVSGENKTEFNGYRWQEYNDGKVHVHDDKNGLVFERKDKYAFQLSMDDFVKNQWRYNNGSTVLVKGEPTTSGKPADIILTREADKWTIKLVDSNTVSANHVVGDQLISFIDKFINGIS